MLFTCFPQYKFTALELSKYGNADDVREAFLELFEQTLGWDSDQIKASLCIQTLREYGLADLLNSRYKNSLKAMLLDGENWSEYEVMAAKRKAAITRETRRRLSEEDVRSIKANDNLTISELASMLRVSNATISAIRRGKTWRDV